MLDSGAFLGYHPLAMTTHGKSEESRIPHDVRLLDRRLRRGQLSRKELEKYLKTLPDATDKAATVEVSPPSARR